MELLSIPHSAEFNSENLFLIRSLYFTLFYFIRSIGIAGRNSEMASVKQIVSSCSLSLLCNKNYYALCFP